MVCKGLSRAWNFIMGIYSPLSLRAKKSIEIINPNSNPEQSGRA